jgi:hypothetical protein
MAWAKEKGHKQVVQMLQKQNKKKGQVNGSKKGKKSDL